MRCAASQPASQSACRSAGLPICRSACSTYTSQVHYNNSKGLLGGRAVLNKPSYTAAHYLSFFLHACSPKLTKMQPTSFEEIKLLSLCLVPAGCRNMQYVGIDIYMYVRVNRIYHSLGNSRLPHFFAKICSRKKEKKGNRIRKLSACNPKIIF